MNALKAFWKFLSGDWFSYVYTSEEEVNAAIEASEVPLCGDKHKHYYLVACEGYCIDCKAIEYHQQEQQKQEELATLIVNKVLQGMK